jgi:hypothetical protein
LGIAGAALGGFFTGFAIGSHLREHQPGEAALDTTGFIPVVGEVVGFTRLIPLKVQQEIQEDESRRQQGYPPARRPYNY